ncbi:MAG TPA: chitobiase/beta-hexosaminidase C-terminal domain-containing protein, partial [Solirubrobacteraceae bacterium]
PGDCWEGFTPDIRPGDVVRVTADGGTDEVTVDNIRIDQGPLEEPPGSGVITMRGIAERGDAARSAIDVAELNSGEVRNTSKFRATPDAVTRTPGTASGWTMTFNPPYAGVFRNGLGADPFIAILSADVLGMGFGHVVPLPAETQLADGVGDTPGPALGCEISPAAPNGGVGATSVRALNIEALAGKADGDVALEVSGLAAQGATTGSVTLSDGTTSVTAAAEGLAGGAADQQGWTARFTKAQVDTLAEGKLTATPTFTGAGPDTTGVERAIAKDTVAPALTADLAPGTYTGTQKIGLDAGGDARITYRTDGQPATTTDQVFGRTPIELRAGTHTITALAVDAAGNRTAASFTYTIESPAAAIAPVALGPSQTQPAVNAPATRSLKVLALRVRGRVKRAEVRRKGLRVAMRLAAGTRMVRVSVFRRERQGYELVTRALRVPGRGGDYTVRLNDARVRRALRVGRYVVEITPGGANGRLSDGDSRSRSLRIVR